MAFIVAHDRMKCSFRLLCGPRQWRVVLHIQAKPDLLPQYYIYKDVAEENYEKPSLKGEQVPNNCCLVALYKDKY